AQQVLRLASALDATRPLPVVLLGLGAGFRQNADAISLKRAAPDETHLARVGAIRTASRLPSRAGQLVVLHGSHVRLERDAHMILRNGLAPYIAGHAVLSRRLRALRPGLRR